MPDHQHAADADINSFQAVPSVAEWLVLAPLTMKRPGASHLPREIHITKSLTYYSPNSSSTSTYHVVSGRGFSLVIRNAGNCYNIRPIVRN